MTTISETLALRGTLRGHGDWVTSLATTPEDPNLLLSSSRDKSVIVWSLTHSSTGDDDSYGYARRGLRGHSHFVSDVVISSDGAFALSASWDSELRLWDISSGKLARLLVYGIHFALSTLDLTVCTLLLSVNRKNHSPLCRPRKGCSFGCFLCGQQANCFWISRLDNPSLEHAW